MCGVVTSACTAAALGASCAGYSKASATFSFRICLLAAVALWNFVGLSERHGAISQLSTLHGNVGTMLFFFVFFFLLVGGYMRGSEASRECLVFM